MARGDRQGWVAAQVLRGTEVKPTDIVHDLRSGDGRNVLIAARQFDARGKGRTQRLFRRTVP